MEKNMDAFATCTREQLVRHGLRALKESLVQDRALTVDNTSISIVGSAPSPSAPGKTVPEPFMVYDCQDVEAWIDSVADDKEPGGDDDAAA